MLFTSVMFSQNISGTIYDNEAPIRGAKIMNITSKSITSSDGNGNFEIQAQPKDTLIFSSLFHHTKQGVVSASTIKEPQVFELKKIVNELPEVDLHGPTSPKKLDEKEASIQLNQQLKNDIEKHGYKYKKPNTGPLDLLAIGESIIKLFKRKTPKPPTVVETTITADNLVTLFKTDDFFNDNFLLLNLNITKDYKHLFFAFCETKALSSTLLLEENQIYLVDLLLEQSMAFREILKESASQN